jgi:hypothetical protein
MSTRVRFQRKVQVLRKQLLKMLMERSEEARKHPESLVSLEEL